MNTFAKIAGFALLALCSSAHAQSTPIKLASGIEFTVNGQLVASMVSKNKATVRVYMQHDASKKVAVFTDVTRDGDGIIDEIMIYTLALEKLSDEGKSGSKESNISEDTHASFEGKRGLLKLWCKEGADCVARESINVTTGKGEPWAAEDHLAIASNAVAESKALLQSLLKLR